MESGPTSRIFDDERRVAGAKRVGSLHKIAQLLEVDLAWLVDGTGVEPVKDAGKVRVPRASVEAPARVVVVPDPYPSRGPILDAARRRGFDPEAVAVVATVALESDGDPGPDHWLRELKEWSRKLRELDLGDEDEAERTEAEVVEDARRAQQETPKPTRRRPSKPNGPPPSR